MPLLSETDLLAQLKDWWTTDTELAQPFVERARENYLFFTGIQQWDPEVVAKLRGESKPALTINKILSTVLMPCGYQRRNRRDLKLYPMRGGNAAVAELGSALLKDTIDRCTGHYEMSDAFADGCVAGKGWLSLQFDFQQDPLHGDLVLRRESPFDILEDQTNKRYDVNDGMRVFRSAWYDRGELELLYPDHAEDLGDTASDISWDTNEPLIDWMFDSGPDTPASYLYGYDIGSYDALRKLRYLVRECWFKVWETLTFAVDYATGNVYALRDRRAVNQAAEIRMQQPAGRIDIVERPGPVLYRAVVAGDVVLAYERDPLRGIATFPYFRFSPYFADGYHFGIVDNIKGPQEELNKRRSQSLHITNQSGGNQWIADSFKDKYDDYVRKHAAKPGAVFTRSKAPGLDRLDGPQLDTAHAALAQQSDADIKDISGINSDLVGTTANANESGKARMVRQEAGLVTNEMVFDNFDRVQITAGSVTWEVIRRGDVYSEAEIQAIVEADTLQQFMQKDPFTGEVSVDLMTAMRNWGTGRYGVKVEQTPNSPTMRQAQVEILLDAFKNGLQIPPEIVIDSMDLPNKQKVLEAMQQAQQAAAQNAQQKQQLEQLAAAQGNVRLSLAGQV